VTDIAPQETGRPGLFCLGLPEDTTISVNISDTGQVEYEFPNLLELPPALLKSIYDSHDGMWFPRIEGTAGHQHRHAINLCADLDVYANALAHMDRMFGPGFAVFNHPRAVAMARRDVMADVLKDIPEIVTRKCSHFLADRPTAFAETFEKAGMRFPVEVQPTRARNTAGLVRVHEAADWEKVLATDWAGQWHFMTRLGNPPADNAWRVRICVLGNFWSGQAYRMAAATRAVPAPTKVFERLRPVMERIIRAVPLDYWHLDLGLRPEGKFMLLSCAPGLPAVPADIAEPGMGRATFELRQTIAPKLRALLYDPALWRKAAPEKYRIGRVMTRFGGPEIHEKLLPRKPPTTLRELRQ